MFLWVSSSIGRIVASKAIGCKFESYLARQNLEDKMNNKYPLEEIFANKYPIYPTGTLKKRLIKEGILEYKCVLCGNPGSHNGYPLTLQLDHVNGVNNDHRLENVRLLCPNCHTQQDTYAGKNKPRRERIPVVPFLEVKLEKDKELWKEIKNDSAIRLGEWGWRVRVAKLLGITPQNVNKWIARVDPEF